MPRLSDEARGAAAWRRGGQAPEPPSYLPKEARALWHAITRSRPVDFFDAGSAVLLENYIVFAVHSRAVFKRLAAASEADSGRLTRQAALIASVLSMLATKLRISVQARVGSRASLLDEGSPEAADDLLGGFTRKVN